ncbi:hypothetical protein SAMN04487937_1848 [Halorubrum sodomense]|uniref:PGF-CTERM archaeal protein-sorting signal domain-containing protein n=1 Tax=Halorubrum sodomense TaxID=35743 RepID=A0A1I6GC11_HALSD|nr:hypothetical protein SAMN04487937_1848 [Halorubrum sodomense]
MNAYASPASPSDFVTTGPGISVDSVTGDTDPLSPGSYDLTLRSEYGAAVANDSAAITVNPRSTTDLTAYTTREAAPGDFEDATAIRNAIANGTLTDATNATANDTVVYAVNATGLTGLPAAANASLERGADLARLDGLSFGVTPTDANDTDASATGDALGPTPNESAVHLDRDGLFLVADGETAFGTETPPAAGETFEAAFRVDDERLRRAANGDHRVTTRLTYAADPTDEGGANLSDDGSTATPSPSTEPTESTGLNESTESTGLNESTESSESSEPTEAAGTSAPAESGSADRSDPPAGSGGSAGPADVGGSSSATDQTDPRSARAGNATEAAGPGRSGEPNGSDVDRPTPRPGVGTTVPPGASGIPPATDPAKRFGTGSTGRTADDASERGSRPGDGRSGGDAGSEGSAASESADSSEPAGPADSNESKSDEAAARDLGYDDAPIRSTVYDLPGFGSVASLAALTIASLLARRRAPDP